MLICRLLDISNLLYVPTNYVGHNYVLEIDTSIKWEVYLHVLRHYDELILGDEVKTLSLKKQNKTDKIQTSCIH